MTRDEVLALARKSEGEEQQHGMWRMHVEDLERFAALVAAHEREECAQIAEEWLGPTKDRELHIAAAIRSRTCP